MATTPRLYHALHTGRLYYLKWGFNGETLGIFSHVESPKDEYDFERPYFLELASSMELARTFSGRIPQGFGGMNEVKEVSYSDLPLYLHMEHKSEYFFKIMEGVYDGEVHRLRQEGQVT